MVSGVSFIISPNQPELNHFCGFTGWRVTIQGPSYATCSDISLWWHDSAWSTHSDVYVCPSVPQTGSNTSGHTEGHARRVVGLGLVVGTLVVWIGVVGTLVVCGTTIVGGFPVVGILVVPVFVGKIVVFGVPTLGTGVFGTSSVLVDSSDWDVKSFVVLTTVGVVVCCRWVITWVDVANVMLSGPQVLRRFPSRLSESLCSSLLPSSWSSNDSLHQLSGTLSRWTSSRQADFFNWQKLRYMKPSDPQTRLVGMCLHLCWHPGCKK